MKEQAAKARLWGANAGTTAPSLSPLQELALVSVFYLILTAILTHPTMLRLSTHIPGSGDAPNVVWDIWAFYRVVAGHGTSLNTTDLIFFPRSDVPAFWTSPANLLLSLPLTATVGPVLTYNLFFLASFVLGGLCCYLLVRYLTGDKLASLAAGSLFSFSAYHYAHGLGHWCLFSVQWLPLFALSVLRFHRRPDLRGAAHTVVATCLVVVTFPYYGAYFVVPFLICFILYHLRGEGSKVGDRRFLVGLILALALAAGGTLLFYSNYLLPQENVATALRQSAQDIRRYSADLLAYVVPSARHPVFGDRVAPLYGNFSAGANLAEGTVYLGIVTLLLALWGQRRGRGAGTSFWVSLGLVAFILSLGPVLRVNGRELFPLPYALLMKLPLFVWLRAPGRMSVTVLLSLCVLAGYGLRDLLHRVRGRSIARPLVVAMVVLAGAFESLFSYPYQSSSATVPAFYSELMPGESGSEGLFDLPSGPGYSQSTSWYMFYQTQHGRKLAEGYLARTSQPVVLYPHWVLRGGLLSPPVDLLESDTWPAFEACFADLLGYNGIGYVVVQRRAGPFARPYSEEEFQAVRESLERSLGDPTYDDDGLVAHQVAQRAAKARASFGGMLELVDHELVETTVCAEERSRCVYLVTLWQATESLPERYGFYLQLTMPDTSAVVVGQSQNLGYQYSHGDERACYNTTWWAPGVVIADYTLLPIVDTEGDALSGNFDIRVWVASPQTGTVLEATSDYYEIDDRGRLLIDGYRP